MKAAKRMSKAKSICDAPCRCTDAAHPVADVGAVDVAVGVYERVVDSSVGVAREEGGALEDREDDGEDRVEATFQADAATVHPQPQKSAPSVYTTN